MKYAFASIVTGLLCAALVWPAAADVYKWKDKNGQVHYGQSPPVSGDFEAVAPPPPPADPQGSATLLEQLQKSNEAAATARQLEGERKAEADRQAAERAEKCRAARQNKAQLANHVPNMLMKMPDGSYSRMTIDERQRRSDEAARLEAETCDR